MTIDQNDVGVINTPEGDWLQTYSGKRVSVLNPQPEQIDINDIARGLSFQCRFNGQTTFFYSVAQHSFMGSQLASKYSLDKTLAKRFLLHDATEAYVGDLIRPVKRALPEFKTIEKRFKKAIALKFGIPEEDDEEVHYLDNLMLAWEKKYLLPNSSAWPDLPPLYPSTRFYKFTCLPPEKIRKAFRKRFDLLFGET